MSRRFTVTAERTKGGWWALECAEVGAVSQVRRLDQAADDVREAIAYLAELPESEIDIEVVPVLPEGAIEHWARANELRQAAAEANHHAAQEARMAARELAAAGLPVRDVGAVLGVSHQRAHQLIKS